MIQCYENKFLSTGSLMEFMKASFVISDRLIFPLVGSSLNELNYCGQLFVLEFFLIVIIMISLSIFDRLVMPI